MMGLPEALKSFKIGLAVLIQYRRVTSNQPATQPRCVASIALTRSVAWVKSECWCAYCLR